ncbi:CerR family C-terminal domain-containing protein [Burkholderia plantarii]|uniref:CerR family C-terminal domain-containing protein n=1 Tax=Burkholderia plantarii TaxID=41899 RepID=UPI000870A7B9|nr:CerR family C-terminal domain-containing protein [Burkholderia plantarii]WLE60576.1 CerR family C-terminal domain-containing protein [Burkholderia plantarii]
MTEAKKLRRASSSGYARGDETRQRIIEAAIELFGERGFAGASTRDIAARAGVNAPALQYYFENKEGVFRACADAIADTACGAFGQPLDHARAMLDAQAGVETLIDAFLGIMHAISERMFTAPKTVHQRMFFAREQAGLEPNVATEILMERIRRPLNDVCAELVGRISGLDPESPVTRIRAFSLLGQLTVFHIAQRSALTLLGWESFDGGRGALLRATIDGQTRMLLRQWHAEHGVLPAALGAAMAATRDDAAASPASPPAPRRAAARRAPAARGTTRETAADGEPEPKKPAAPRRRALRLDPKARPR